MPAGIWLLQGLAPKAERAACKILVLSTVQAPKHTAACWKCQSRANFINTEEKFLCCPAGKLVFFNKTINPPINVSKVINKITAKFWLKEYLMWLQLKFALWSLSDIQKLKQNKRRMSKERGDEGKKTCLPSVQTPCKCKYPESLLWHWHWSYT